MDKNKITYWETIQVNMCDCDSYKVVHNARYIEWFEQGLYNYWTSHHGIGFWEDLNLFIEDLRCRYLHSLLLGDDLEIYTTMEEDKLNKDKYQFNQRMYNHRIDKIASVCRGTFYIRKKKVV